MNAPSIDNVLRDADQLLPRYLSAIAKMPAEKKQRGICRSEMFFVYAVVHALGPAQILESGRARGQSTLTLAHCFPKTRVISVELDRSSPDAGAAEADLEPFANVECLYGDSRRLLPQRLQAGDAVLIDGPKEFRALKLALRLLRTGKPVVVFLHDFGQGRAERKFVERHWPGAFFSDNPEFSMRFGSLDDDGDGTDWWRHPRLSTMACLPGSLPAPYPVLLARLMLARAGAKAGERLRGVVRRGFRG